jgi:hypothetical protein
MWWLFYYTISLPKFKKCLFVYLKKKYSPDTKKYTHDILTPLPMAFWPPTHGISTPLIHGILTHLPMVYWSPYAWYFDPSAYLLIRNEGVQFSIRGGAIYHGWKLTPESIYHGGQNTIWHRSFLHSWPITGFVTILTRVPLVEQEQPTFPEHPSSPRFLVGFVLLDL